MIKAIYNLVGPKPTEWLFTVSLEGSYCPIPSKGDYIMLNGVEYLVEKIILDYGDGHSLKYLINVSLC